MEEFDAVIIGAGLSGLGAGIRLSHFGKKVALIEKHSLWGGLNSFYRKDGRLFDVGLHALTNFAPKGKSGPLQKICRQLRLDWDAFELCPQGESEIRFPSCALRFSNDPSLLKEEVGRKFPRERENFLALWASIDAYDHTQEPSKSVSARTMVQAVLGDSLLAEILLCPILFYGSPQEDDIDWHAFTILFKAIFFEGLSRPRHGMRGLLQVLVDAFKSRGGELRLGTEVERLVPTAGAVEVFLKNGKGIRTKRVLSSAGKRETLRLLDLALPSVQPTLSFFETIHVLNVQPNALGLDASVIFYNHQDKFSYRTPQTLADLSSGVVCVPTNFDGEVGEGRIRITHLANYSLWKEAKVDGTYDDKKEETLRAQWDSVSFLPPLKDHVVYSDSFTPTTIKHFTSHEEGAVYGVPEKTWSGDLGVGRVYLCGSDQGLLGIVGSLLSGILMANKHVLLD